MRKSSQSPAGSPVRVLIADNTQMSNQLLAAALGRERRCKVVGTAENSEQALSLLTGAPEVVLLAANIDNLPNKGFEVSRQLRARRPETKIVMLLDSAERDAVIEAFRAGARGVLHRNQPIQALSKCIQAVQAGQVWASSKELILALDALSVSVLRSAPAGNGKTLTEREQRIIRLVAEGLTNRQIADAIHLSEHTVKNCLLHLFNKLGVSSRVEIVFAALTQDNAAILDAPLCENLDEYVSK